MPSPSTPALTRRLAPVLATLLLGLIAVAAAHPLDAPLAAWLPTAFPAGTGLHEALKRSFCLFDWGWFVILGLALALFPARQRLLSAYLALLAAAFGVLHLLKLAIGRARPDQRLGPWTFAPFSDPAVGYDAFPSGHAAQALLLAALLGIYWPRSRWFFYPAALLVCFSRLALDRHYLSDVVAAAALVALALAVARQFPRAFRPLSPAELGAAAPETAPAATTAQETAAP